MTTTRTTQGVVLGLAIWAGALACTKRDDGGKPAAVPPLDPSGVPAAPPSAPAAAPPAPSAAPAAPSAADPGASITGQIVLAPALAKAVPGGALYLVARRLSDNPSARGTLIAVKKLPVGPFPLSFTLTAADMPFQNGAFDGELTLTARIDQDADPMSRQKGDLYGSLPKVQVGSRDVKLPLDQVQKEAESLAQPGGAMGGPMGAGPTGPHGLPPGHPQ